jgi:hypothetical protein
VDESECFASDRVGHVVEVFMASKGVHTHTIGVGADDETRRLLHRPSALALAHGRLIVADEGPLEGRPGAAGSSGGGGVSSRVLVFTRRGNPLQCVLFGAPPTPRPGPSTPSASAWAIDIDGSRAHLLDHGSKRMITFQLTPKGQSPDEVHLRRERFSRDIPPRTPKRCRGVALTIAAALAVAIVSVWFELTLHT